jgi:hypothetical protein
VRGNLFQALLWMVDKTNQAKVTLDCAVYALSEDNYTKFIYVTLENSFGNYNRA